MEAQDDAVKWVQARFSDSNSSIDARVRDKIARNPGFAAVIRVLITRPSGGLAYRIDIGRAQDAALETPQVLAQLNARLRLIGAQAVPVADTPDAPGTGCGVCACRTATSSTCECSSVTPTGCPGVRTGRP